MTEKIFTEEVYNKIVQAYGMFIEKEAWGFLDHNGIDKFAMNLSDTCYFDYYNEIIAIANPLTREWAHEEFVKKETLYFWTSKKANNDGDNMRLYKINGGAIMTNFGTIYDQSPLTESEIKEWGYNPEAFDREEIK